MKSRALYFFIPPILLGLPLLFMQFTPEVNWQFNDFLVGGILLFGVSFLLYQTKKLNQKTMRHLLALTIVALFSFIWIELAVGVFD